MSIFTRLANMLRRTSTSRANWRDQTPTWPRVAETGDFVTEDRAMSVAAFWRGHNVLTGAMSQLPWRVMERKGQDSLPAETHPAWDLLDYAPNPMMDAPTFRELMMSQCLLWGNGYAEIERVGGRPVNLWPIEAWRVTHLDMNTESAYEVRNNWQGDEDPVYLPAADMLHFRGPGDNLYGWSVLRQAANALGLSLSGESSMSNTLRNQARFSGLMAPPGGGKITLENAQALKAKFDEEMTGPRAAGRVFWATNGLEFTPFNMPNSDVELLESRKFSVLEIARFIGVPPTLLFSMDASTYNNNEQMSLDFVIYSLAPWVVRFENQANRKLITYRNHRRYYTNLETKALLRGDLTSRANFYKTLFDKGALSPDDIRRLEDMPGINSEASRSTYMQTSMAPIDAIYEGATQPEVPPEDVTPVDEEPDDLSAIDQILRERAGNNGRD